MKQEILKILACPKCKSPLEIAGGNLRCVKCNSEFKITDGIIYFKPVGKIRKLPVAFKKEIKKEWLAHYQQGEIQALKEEWKWKINKLNLKRSKIHLDWATGTGRFLREILTVVKGEIIALDADYATCVWLVKFLRRIGKYPRISVVYGDARNMPFRDNAFDSISSWHGLDEPEINKALDESKRVLKKNKVIATSGFFIEKGSKSLKLAGKFRMRFLEKGKACRYFQRTGFKDVAYQEFFRGRWSEKGDFLPKFNDKYVIYGISGRK